MQIGWCSSKCHFSQDGAGVGDTEYSYGYDGSKLLAWHGDSHTYGTIHWRNGDVLTVCLDLEQNHAIQYFRKGQSLGDAFTDVAVAGDGGALYPAITLAFNESVTANFGGVPFRYPVPGFKPLQDVPTDKSKKCECLLSYLTDLSHFMSKNSSARRKDVKMGDGTTVSTDAVLLIFGSMIVDRLAGLLQDVYVVHSCVFPFIKRLCVMRSVQGRSPIQPGCEESTLGNLLTLLWDHMDYDIVTEFIDSYVRFMESIYTEVSHDIEYEKQRSIIVVLTCLCNHTRTRKYLLAVKFFKHN